MEALEPELVEFVGGTFRSLWAVETLLLLMRHSPEGRAASEIVRELRASGSLVETCLEHLTRAGLVAREGAEARYAPANERLRRLAEELERAYRQRPLAIINVVVHRGRVSPIQRFADAFRFREPKE